MEGGVRLFILNPTPQMQYQSESRVFSRFVGHVEHIIARKIVFRAKASSLQYVLGDPTRSYDWLSPEPKATVISFLTLLPL